MNNREDFNQFDGIIRDFVGDYEVLTSYRERDARTGVYKLKTKYSYCVLKLSLNRIRWSTELYSYKNWTPLIEPYAPRLIGSFDTGEIQGLLISFLDGKTLRESGLNEDHILSAYRKAGELTKQLHSSASGIWFGKPDENGNPIEIYHSQDPVSYIRTHLLRFINPGVEKGYLLDGEVRLGKWAHDNVEVFRDEKPEPVNWDSSTGNWLVNESGDFVGLIDFEHMTWGVKCEEFAKAFERDFPLCPKGQRAFFEGYDPEFPGKNLVALKICCIKKGLGDVVFGSDWNLPKVLNDGREFLARITSENWI